MPRPPAPPVRPVAARGPSMGLIGGVVVLVVALIAVLVWAATRGSGLDAVGSSSTLPEGGGVSVGPGVETDVMQVRVYEDFQCPWCGRFEASVGEELTQKALDGEINITYQIMSFLDGVSSDRSSTRAANAALCADDAGIFVPFHASVYANQPAEGVGYTDDQFIGWAEEAGLGGAELDTFTSCVQNLAQQDYVEAMQERANKDSVTSTPTVVVDGDTLGQEEMSTLLEDPSALDDILGAHS